MGNGITWEDLPRAVRDLAEQHVGTVAGAVPADTGNHASLAVTLHHANGSKTFAKGAPTDDIEGRLIRYESRILPAVASFAPRLLALVEAGGWTVMLLEHIHGRHADYSPDSSDLDLVAKAVGEFQTMQCPKAVTIPVERRWHRLTDDLSPMTGDSMIHADINPANVLITPDERIYVLDWALACHGAAWVEPAILVQWLISGGHTPAQAETWISRFPSWQAAEPAELTRLAHLNAELWRSRAESTGLPWAADIAAWTGQWAAHRSTFR